MNGERTPTFEFHVSRAVRERYGMDDTLFALGGNVVLANLAAVRAFAKRINERRRRAVPPEPEVSPGDLNAMGLIDEVLHYVVALYRRERDPNSMTRALESIDRELGRERVDQALAGFAEAFPAVEVHRGRVGVEQWLGGESGGVPHRAVALEELVMLRLANENPACAPFRELFDDRTLPARAACDELLAALERWLANRPRFGPSDQMLLDMLRTPAREHPDSLTAQLDWIRRHWGYLLGDLMLRLLTGLDVLAEEEHARWLRDNPTDWWRLRDSGSEHVIRFGGADHEAERFTPDRDWMPRVVLLAKSAYVWLDQLSRSYGREVRRLDEIPDEELDRLARWGFSGVWLIGVWERSRASQRVKQLCGNPDAAASAYSLLDYAIARDLGGEAALERLQRRAWERGLRLASDMVPNHMGIDSRWVIEHPDRFLSLPEPPFGAYTYHGPDLSTDDRVSIQIEDHYYDRSDAAVTFKRTDRWTGDTRYVYHGNDGTSTPWNDTAQIDYLNAEAREAVIQTILHVCRRFPIVRFDAAMTLAKRHYQRLWFPEPGTGGAIPSRAEHGLTKAQFDAAIPQEFWREVVDRAARETPDTLLLAEAFWLMEGYFVRTLGMHRVYNSAFMNMLRDEQNANYRSVIKNTLEFDPEVLKRYVNFMSNPDERTAVDQFGKGDKYLGVCTLMATLPGLPMFGHGQVEGFEERYGMEFLRATREERPDADLIAAHEHAIFPLLHRRHLFAEVQEFQLYDCFDDSGHVNEDVFAYSNRRGDERALVLVHNRYADTAGWIRLSVAAMRSQGGARHLVRKSLGEALALTAADGVFTRYRDFTSGLEYVRPSRLLCDEGLRVELRAYGRRVLLDFREVRDAADHPWATLERELGGRGVHDLEDALDEVRRRPLTVPFAELLEPDVLRGLAVATTSVEPWLDRIEAGARELLEAARARGIGRGDAAAVSRDVRIAIETALATARADHAHRGADGVRPPAPAWQEPRTWGVLLVAEIWRALGALAGTDAPLPIVREWRLDRVAAGRLQSIGLDPAAARDASALAATLVAHAPFLTAAAKRRLAPDRVFAHWLGDDQLRRRLGVHTHADVEWFRKEPMDDWLGFISVLAAAPEPGSSGASRRRAPKSGVAVADAPPAAPVALTAWLASLAQWALGSEWRTDRLIQARTPPTRRTPAAPGPRKAATTRSRKKKS